ncbi:hypothetical protein RHOSPDRAFT_26885 [Rhodotorula sp. JG-1b]|nr:hypothetical protein RHOSPDRAFT_26885 [Rhodotorula sp. JG-1b]
MLSKLGRKLEAIRNLSVAQPERVGPPVAEFCTAIERAEATAQAQRSFNWTERNPETRAILAELDTVCKKLSALTRDYFWGVQEHMYLYNVNTLLRQEREKLTGRIQRLQATPRRPHRGIVQQLLDSIREAYGDDPDKACAEFCQEVRKAWSNIGEQWASTGSDIHTRIKSSLTQLQKNVEFPRRLRTLEDEHAWASQKKALLHLKNPERLAMVMKARGSNLFRKLAVSSLRRGARRQKKKAAAAATAADAAPIAPATNSVGHAARLVMSAWQQRIYASTATGTRRGLVFGKSLHL